MVILQFPCPAWSPQQRLRARNIPEQQQRFKRLQQNDVVSLQLIFDVATEQMRAGDFFS